mgnify:CR=1 FL=1
MKCEKQIAGPLPLSRARALLCPVVRQVSASKRGKVAISVRGKVSAYLVSAERLRKLEEAERVGARTGSPKIRGTLELIGALEDGQASKEHAAQAVRRWDRGMGTLSGQRK